MTIDLYGRKVIARQSYRIDHHLVCSTLKQALFWHHFPKNVLIDSDQGNQYCSADFKQLLLQYGLSQRMRRIKSGWINAVDECFLYN